MKRISIIVLVLAIIIGLTSCGVKASSEQDDNKVPSQGEIDNAILLNQEPNEPEVSIGLHAVTTEYGLLGTTAVSDKYAVEIDTVSTGGAFLNIFDFDTMKKTQLGSEYNAFIKDIMGGASPIILGDELYVIKHGTLPMEDFDGYGSWILKINADGSQEKVCQLSADEVFDLGMVVADEDNNLYFIVQVFGRPDDEGLIESRLIKYNILNDEGEVLRSWDRYQRVSIVGAISSGIVLQTQGTVFDPDIDLELFFPVSGRTAKSVLSFLPGQKTYSIDTLNDCIYVYDAVGDYLDRISIKSGESERIKDNFGAGSQKENIILFGNVIEDMIPFYSDIDTDWQFCGYSIKDDRFYTPNQKYSIGGADERDVRIVGSMGDCYFVLCDVELAPYTYYDDNGNEMYTNERAYQVFALIQKENFWNAVPSYLLFE